MTKIKIGIPRSLYYYYYGNLLKNFFENLDLEVVVSPKTTKQIMDIGSKYAYDEMCLSLKNYLGHVDYLKDKCDYVVIPRIDNYGINDQTCTNFLATYDIVNNLFNIKILNYNINYLNGENELKAFLNLGKQLNFSYSMTLEAYNKAKVEDMNYKDKQIRLNMENLDNENIKILIVGHPYNVYDDCIGSPILDILKRENITLIYSNLFKEEKANKMSKKLSHDLYFKYNKENIGAIELSKNKIDGIIFITSFPCGPDSLANELAIRKLKLPYLNIIVDDLDSMAGFETRIESFLDIIKERREQCIK